MHPSKQGTTNKYAVILVEGQDTKKSFADLPPHVDTLTGFTLFHSREVMDAYIVAGFIDSVARKALGYTDNNSLSWRLRQIINRDTPDINVLAAYRALKDNGRTPFTLRQLLNPFRTNRCGRPYSSARTAVSNRLCHELINKYGTKREACLVTSVPRASLNFWLEEA
jgi:hypothetical protein